MSRTPISKEELERMIFDALRAKHADLQQVGIVRGTNGWTCHVVQDGPGSGPVAQVSALLAQLLQQYAIVDERGRELDGKF
jgi:hypothetical protein